MTEKYVYVLDDRVRDYRDIPARVLTLGELNTLGLTPAEIRDYIKIAGKTYNPNQPRWPAGDPHGGRWKPEEQLDAEPAGTIERWGLAEVPVPVYRLNSTRSMEGYKAFVVEIGGDEVLASSVPNGHTAIVDAVYQGQKTVDNYVRFVWDNFSKTLAVNTKFAGVVDVDRYEANENQAMDNIYEAFDTLVRKGMDPQTKVNIRMQTSVSTLNTTLQKALKRYNPDQPREAAGSPIGGQWTSEGKQKVRRSTTSMAGSLIEQLNGGGFSASVAGDSPKKGYMVAKSKDTEVTLPLKEVTGNFLVDYAVDHFRELNVENAYLGGWVDNGTAYIDVSYNIDDLKEAMEIAKKAKQEGVYDVVNGVTIYTEEYFNAKNKPVKT